MVVLPVLLYPLGPGSYNAHRRSVELINRGNYEITFLTPKIDSIHLPNCKNFKIIDSLPNRKDQDILVF